VRAGTGITLETEGTVDRGYMAFRCRPQEIIRHNWGKWGVKIIKRQEDTGSVDPAFDRDCKFTIPGNKGLAGTAVLVLNFIRCKTFDTRRGSHRAGAGKEDNFALIALSLSSADALKRNFSTPYGIEHGGIQWYRDELVYGVEKYAGGLRHTLPRDRGDREILIAGSRAWY